MTEYDEMFNKFQTGEITDQEWEDYCFKVLAETLEKHMDVFYRLKDR